MLLSMAGRLKQCSRYTAIKRQKEKTYHWLAGYLTKFPVRERKHRVSTRYRLNRDHCMHQ